jgi:CTP:molybdopterin cytidylyltransferase MocA
VRAAGLVLAAGASRRLGAPKALLELDGERLVDRAVRVLREGGCRPVLVVSGAVPLEVAGAEVVPNRDWRSGMGSSLRAGLAALHERADVAVISLVDLPGVGPEVVARLLGAADAGAEVVVATYAGTRRHPVLLAAGHWAAAAAAAVGDVGARGYLATVPHLVSVECGDVADAQDIDTDADVEAWRRRLSDGLEP